MRECLIPKLFANDDDYEVVGLLVEDGDQVQAGQTVIELESSKATSDMQVEVGGYIKLKVRIGDTVRVGETFAEIFESHSQCISSEDVSTTDGKKSGVQQPDVKAHTEVMPQIASKQSLKFNGKFSFTRFSDDAEKMIATHGLDRAAFNGMGLITSAVVRDCLNLPTDNPVANDEQRIERPRSEANTLNVRIEPVSSAKQTEIEYLLQGQEGLLNSALTVQFDSCGIRRTLEWSNNQDETLLPLILYELSRLVPKHPKVNAYWSNKHTHYYQSVDIAVAMDLDEGLKAPVIRDADQSNLMELKNQLNSLTLKYLNHQFSPEDLSGGTLTVSDLSSQGILYFQPLLNRRQSCILGIGGEDQGDLYPMTMTCVFDHRVLSGREVSLFLNELKDRVLKYSVDRLESLRSHKALESIRCWRCSVSHQEYTKKYQDEANMLLSVKPNGEQAYICHLCASGY